MAERQLVSAPVAAISGCCMPVNLYFYYMCGSALPQLGELTGNPGLKNKSTLLMILGFFVPMVSAMIVQGHVNELYGRA